MKFRRFTVTDDNGEQPGPITINADSIAYARPHTNGGTVLIHNFPGETPTFLAEPYEEVDAWLTESKPAAIPAPPR